MMELNERTKIAVVGAGPAGLTSAFKLFQKGYKNVTIYEQNNYVGGRTHSVSFSNQNEKHIIDTGAGWLTNFYYKTFELLNELSLNQNLVLRRRQIRGASELLVFTHPNEAPTLHSLPLTKQEIETSTLLTETEKTKILSYLEDLKQTYSNSLKLLPKDIKSTSDQEYSELGENIVKYMMAPLFEGPFFCQLCDLCASMTNSWLSALLHPDTEFYQMSNGMDDLWKYIAQLLVSNHYSVLVDHQIQSFSFNNNNQSTKLELTYKNSQNEIQTRGYDIIIFAIPPPLLAPMLPYNYHELNSNIPRSIIKNFQYSPQVRIYISRKSNEDKAVGYHLIPVQEPLATIEWFSGNNGSWGTCPVDRQWVLLCSTVAASNQFMDNNFTNDQIIQTLWKKAKELIPDLFDYQEADVRHVVRWKNAIPILSPDVCNVINKYTPNFPLLFVGDWSYQPCIEGAIRSAERAINIFPSLKTSKL